MQITFKIGEENKEYVGYIEKKNNNFFVKLEVSHGTTLPTVIVNMKGFYEEIGIITMMNNQNISVSEHRDNPDISIYTYESDYVIYGDVDEATLLIKTMIIYFKESDYFFIKDKHKINYNSDNHQFQILQNRVSNVLLENDEVIIEYTRHGGIKKNEYGEKIFINPAYININFKKNIVLNDVFEQLRKIECVLGFVFNRKMNLIDLAILSSDKNVYTIIPPFKKEFTDIKISETPVVDLTSFQLLKDVLKKYYSDKHIASAINMYYEYLYNDLDNIFEFTSLVNTIELIIASEYYKDKVKAYTLANSTKLLDNNKKMNEILEVLSEGQRQFINSFYNFENVELRDKMKYIFEDVFRLVIGKGCDKYISSIINTRNYYVHGTKYRNTLTSVNLVLTKNLLRNILYLLIVYACSVEENLLINVYQETIPIVYKNIIDDYNK